MVDSSLKERPTPSGGAGKGRSHRWQLLLIAAIFLVPVVAAYYSYYVARPTSRTNFGTLIEPQMPMPELTATALDGKPVPLKSLLGKWLLISVAGGACDAECRDNLYLQHQIRTSMGKNIPRIDWVWLIDDDQPIPDALKGSLAGAQVLRVPRAEIAQWLRPGPQGHLADHLYVVDPLGHWMMRFPPHLDQETAKKARRDLSKLLYASAGWNVDRPAAAED